MNLTADISQDDITALRTQGDLIALLKQDMREAPKRNEARRSLVARYPDLWKRITEMPGHSLWTGSVGHRQDVAAIVAEAEQRAATEHRGAAA